MKTAENKKLPIAVKMDQELQHFSISRTEGEALEVVRGAEREPGLEQWRRLAAQYDPLAAGKSLDVSLGEFGTTTPRTHWRPVVLRHVTCYFFMRTIDLKKELTAQQYLFPDNAQMKAHMLTVVNSRTRGVAPMMMKNLSDEDSNHRASSDKSVESEDAELYRLEIRNGKKVFANPRHDPSKSNTKEGGKRKTEECFRCGRIDHTRADCRAKTHIIGGLPKSAPTGKGVGSCVEGTETSQHVPLGTIDLGSFDLGSFEVLS